MAKCSTKYCKNEAHCRNICSSCYSRAWREQNKIKYTYTNLKNNSLRRAKIFSITLADFTEFCHETNYLQGKGKTKTSFSIDCVRNEDGYTKENIRVLPLGENSRKGTKSLDYDWQTGKAKVINLRHDYTEEQLADMPF